MLAGGRTSRLQPGAVCAIRPVHSCTMPDSGSAVRNGGAQPRSAAGAASSNASEKCGNCADGDNGIQSGAPSKYQKMSCPSQINCRSIGANTHHPYPAALVTASQ